MHFQYATLRYAVVDNLNQRPPRNHYRCFVVVLFPYTKNNNCSWGDRRGRLQGQRRAGKTKHIAGRPPLN